MKTTTNNTIDIQKCNKLAGNKFDLILMAAYRAREIPKNKIVLGASSPRPAVQALLDIEHGVVGRELLRRVGQPKSRNSR